MSCVFPADLTTFLSAIKHDESAVDELQRVLDSVGVVTTHWATTEVRLEGWRIKTSVRKPLILYVQGHGISILCHTKS